MTKEEFINSKLETIRPHGQNLPLAGALFPHENRTYIGKFGKHLVEAKKLDDKNFGLWKLDGGFDVFKIVGGFSRIGDHIHGEISGVDLLFIPYKTDNVLDYILAFRVDFGRQG